VSAIGVCACAQAARAMSAMPASGRICCIVQEKMQVTPPRSLVELFTGFLAIGARSFGGVMPWAYRTMVEERRWLTAADFAETVGLCQFLPGPNIGNASIVLGKRWFGAAGALVAFLGLMALPFIWVMALGVVYLEWSSQPMVRAVVTAVGATGAGLFIATALKLGKAIARKPAALALVAACFLCVGVGRLSMLMVLPIGAALGVLFARRGWL
jgi:chromate transporter